MCAKLMNGACMHSTKQVVTIILLPCKLSMDSLQTDEGFQSGAVEDILETPEKLKDLDLDAFAEELERQVCRSVSYIFITIEEYPNNTYVCVLHCTVK